MVLVTGNWRMWLIGTAASLVIFAVVFFTVIQPDQNAANQALKSSAQQAQQAINQAQQQLSTAGSGASTAAGSSAQVNNAQGQAQQTLNNAAKLTACVAAAGTDATQLEACKTKYAK